jgi:hypothetical protein
MNITCGGFKVMDIFLIISCGSAYFHQDDG